MAEDNGWGLGRILGELKKLGIRKSAWETRKALSAARDNPFERES